MHRNQRTTFKPVFLGKNTKENHTKDLAQKRRRLQEKPVRSIDYEFKDKKRKRLQEKLAQSDLSVSHSNQMRKRRIKKENIPPFAKKETPPTPSLTEHVLMLFQPLMASMNKKQLTGLFFIYLVAMAHAADATEQVQKNNNNQAGNSKSSKLSDIKKREIFNACTNKLIPFNKPSDYAVGINKYGVMVPKSCLNPNNENCFKESAQGNSFYKDSSSLSKRRDQVTKIHEEWKSTFRIKSFEVMHTFTKSQILIYEELRQKIENLKLAYLSAIDAQKTMDGNCGENTNVALITLLNKKIEYGFKLKVQVVQLGASHTHNEIDWHMFLLLDSNYKDITVQGREEVKKILPSIKGTICDPWNDGYLGPFQNDDSHLYDATAKWDTLSIGASDVLDFKDFKKLPAPAQKILCEELNNIGLKVKPRSVCEAFFPSQKTEDGLPLDKEVEKNTLDAEGTNMKRDL